MDAYDVVGDAVAVVMSTSFGAHMLRVRYADAIHRALAETQRRPITLIIHHRPLPPDA